MNEDRLQYEMVKLYSELYHDRFRCLWSTRNTTFSLKDGAKQKAMGMLPGVSDLIEFWSGEFKGIEVKQKGKRHSADHITKQYNWGCNVEKNKGRYFIVLSVEGFLSVIKGCYSHPDVLPLKKIKEILDKNKKTIVFS